MRWFLLAALLVGCSWQHRVKYLSDDEFKAYYALKPFLEEEQQKAYLTLKTEEERNGYLKSITMERRPPITLFDLSTSTPRTSARRSWMARCRRAGRRTWC